ncbi:hypothetical protein Hanom_Chr12g01104111 [Helianthus anomalus]
MVLTTVVLKSHSCHFTLQFKLTDFFSTRSRISYPTLFFCKIVSCQFAYETDFSS